jgi:hypothetical protein
MIRRPCREGPDSTFETSSSCSSICLMTRWPSSMCVISRPRNITEMSTLSLCSRKVRARFTFTLMSCSPGLWTDPNLLHLVVMSAALVLAFLLLIFELAVIHHTANGGLAVRCHLDKVEARTACIREGFLCGDNPQLAPIDRNHADLGHTDLLVDTLLLFCCDGRNPPQKRRGPPRRGPPLRRAHLVEPSELVSGSRKTRT